MTLPTCRLLGRPAWCR